MHCLKLSYVVGMLIVMMGAGITVKGSETKTGKYVIREFSSRPLIQQRAELIQAGKTQLEAKRKRYNVHKNNILPHGFKRKKFVRKGCLMCGGSNNASQKCITLTAIKRFSKKQRSIGPSC